MPNRFSQSITAVLDRRVARYLKKKRLRAFFALKAEEFREDRNYALNLVARCYVDNRRELDDADIIRRIVKSYKKARAVQKQAPSFYQVGNEWLPIYEGYLKHVIRALENEDLRELRAIYQNFWRDPCSTGLVGLPVNMEESYFGKHIRRKYKKLHLFSSLHRVRLWRSLMGKEASLGDLSSPAIGNPYYYSIDGNLIKSGSDYLHYYASAIGRLTRSDAKRVVVEIGGGYGGMAYYLLRDNPGLTYVDFDLPENMALTAYYLLNAFPEKKAILYGEAELTPDVVSSNDMVIMPNFEMEKMGADSVDLVFNSYSLAEMAPETIKNYIAFASRMTKKYLFHVNHTKYSLVTADEFGIDSKQFELLYKMPALWNAGINMDMDEFEYLYRKINGQENVKGRRT